jgi:hypothetical protein
MFNVPYNAGNILGEGTTVVVENDLAPWNTLAYQKNNAYQNDFF